MKGLTDIERCRVLRLGWCIHVRGDVVRTFCSSDQWFQVQHARTTQHLQPELQLQLQPLYRVQRTHLTHTVVMLYGMNEWIHK